MLFSYGGWISFSPQLSADPNATFTVYLLFSAIIMAVAGRGVSGLQGILLENISGSSPYFNLRQKCPSRNFRFLRVNLFKQQITY